MSFLPPDPSSARDARSRRPARLDALDEPEDAAVVVRDLAVELPSDERPYAAPIQAVRDLSFTVPAGQVTAIVGTNGAGKTTTLRALSGAVPFSDGSIEVLGTSLGPATVGLPDGVAIVPDAPAYPARWTARHVARAYSSTARHFDRARFDAYLVEHRVPAGRSVGGLSRGQLTRLAVAAALAHDPRLLILDEPLARLDPLARTGMVDNLRALMAREDRTILLSTHDLDGMDRFVDHLVVVAHGQNVLEGDVEMLREEFLLLEQDSAGPGMDGDSIASPMIGAVTTGGTTRALVHLEEAAGLPPGADLRRPGVSELVTHWLRAATATRRPDPRKDAA
ncbi:ABC transporter ATP-binding protein [Brachybacterium tyrofermentans]|uniref:ABC transporter ATP-binding protein n=1 Tax=Brachybacterium tyrofermentans TaxID=47848 RepID=UPI003F906232